MSFFSYIYQQSVHILFLQCLFLCLYNLYFFSTLKNKKLLIFSIVLSTIFPFVYLLINFYTIIFAWMLLMLFNRKALTKDWYLAILYATLSVFLLIFSDYIVEIFFQTIFRDISISIFWRVVLALTVGTVLTIPVKKFLTRIFQDSNHEIFKRILCAFLLFTVSIYYVLISMNRFITNSSVNFRAHVFLLLLYSCLSILLCLSALLVIRKQTDLKVKRVEMEQILHYTQHLEQNYLEIQKFKHDYKNILLSIEILIREQYMEKLAQYYKKYIEPTKHEIDTNFSYLTDLRMVQVPEIKGIFFSKLMRAQGLGIQTNFICRQEISDFYMDSLILVRSLGIILDNAIEEVITSTVPGKITINCTNEKDKIQIFITNTCRKNMPELREMEQDGFSTKGKNRGLGLPNLKKLLSPLRHVTLDTVCEACNFTQIITIHI